MWAGVVLLALAGCASAPAERGSALAHLAVRNHTDYEWRLVITPVTGGAPVITRVGPRQSLGVEVSGGEYLIEQTALGAGDTTELTRRVTARLTAGESYEWALVTLLSDPEGMAP